MELLKKCWKAFWIVPTAVSLSITLLLVFIGFGPKKLERLHFVFKDSV